MKTNVEEIKPMVTTRVNDIAQILARGKDVEIRIAKEGVRVIEVTKKVVE